MLTATKSAGCTVVNVGLRYQGGQPAAFNVNSWLPLFAQAARLRFALFAPVGFKQVPDATFLNWKAE